MLGLTSIASTMPKSSAPARVSGVTTALGTVCPFSRRCTSAGATELRPGTDSTSERAGKTEPLPSATPSVSGDVGEGVVVVALAGDVAMASRRAITRGPPAWPDPGGRWRPPASSAA